eukprot:gene21661-28678_t
METLAGHDCKRTEVAADGPIFCESLQQRMEQLVHRLQPATHSENRRTSVSNFVSDVISKCFAPVQVKAFMFGSVPLRTYLPDGDIDLSIFTTDSSFKDTWAMRLQSRLEEEQRNYNSSFRIGDIHVINAEVKLLKCLVDNIVVDISFNQLGGLCTLAFLEEIDRLVQPDHLFKRSIILVKAWCYYESRLLGAHHGLISTYALETLVLYIFNVHHKRLTNPLEVLYLFLKEFSKFDWDNYTLSLQGPVLTSRIADGKPEPPAKMSEESDMLLSDKLVDHIHSKYSQQQPSSAPGGASNRTFLVRCLNIVDPLLPSNNLGRSVTKASYLRIKRAFTHGLKVLESVMLKEGDEAISALDVFFRNAWNAQRPHRHNRDLAAHHQQALGALKVKQQQAQQLMDYQQQQQQQQQAMLMHRVNSPQLPNGMSRSISAGALRSTGPMQQLSSFMSLSISAGALRSTGPMQQVRAATPGSALSAHQTLLNTTTSTITAMLQVRAATPGSALSAHQTLLNTTTTTTAMLQVRATTPGSAPSAHQTHPQAFMMSPEEMHYAQHMQQQQQLMLSNMMAAPSGTPGSASMYAAARGAHSLAMPGMADPPIATDLLSSSMDRPSLEHPALGPAHAAAVHAMQQLQQQQQHSHALGNPAELALHPLAAPRRMAISQEVLGELHQLTEQQPQPPVQEVHGPKPVRMHQPFVQTMSSAAAVAAAAAESALHVLQGPMARLGRSVRDLDSPGELRKSLLPRNMCSSDDGGREPGARSVHSTGRNSPGSKPMHSSASQELFLTAQPASSHATAFGIAGSSPQQQVASRLGQLSSSVEMDLPPMLTAKKLPSQYPPKISSGKTVDGVGCEPCQWGGAGQEERTGAGADGPLENSPQTSASSPVLAGLGAEGSSAGQLACAAQATKVGHGELGSSAGPAEIVAGAGAAGYPVPRAAQPTQEEQDAEGGASARPTEIAHSHVTDGAGTGAYTGATPPSTQSSATKGGTATAPPASSPLLHASSASAPAVPPGASEPVSGQDLAQSQQQLSQPQHQLFQGMNYHEVIQQVQQMQQAQQMQQRMKQGADYQQALHQQQAAESMLRGNNAQAMASLYRGLSGDGPLSTNPQVRSFRGPSTSRLWP